MRLKGGLLSWDVSNQLEMSEESFWHGIYRQISFGQVKIPHFKGLCAFVVCIRHYFALLNGLTDNTLEQTISEIENSYL